MDPAFRQKTPDILDQNRLMTVATLRPDGWLQATTVGYGNDGLTLYFLCSPQSRKAQNLAKDDRVSLMIDHDVADPMAITGLSMAARATPVRAPAEMTKALQLLAAKQSSRPTSLTRARSAASYSISAMPTGCAARRRRCANGPRRRVRRRA
jgi:nitroimidazol reductase NimA-like FMN-containing flavoprotein (pyridoxamine 5'-phosphate oxidase superfamily)